MDFGTFAAAVQASDFGVWASGSSIAYPLANVVHLLGLVMLVGGIGIVDLRVAGAFRSLPLAPLSRALTPIAVAGLLLMAPSGAVLFAADAAALAGSDVFLRKLVLIGFALANALLFRRLWQRRIDGARDLPFAARGMALLSLLLWLTVGTLGRMIAYT